MKSSISKISTRQLVTLVSGKKNIAGGQEISVRTREVRAEIPKRNGTRVEKKFAENPGV